MDRMEEDIVLLEPLKRTGKGFYLAIWILFSLMVWAFYAWTYQLRHGLGVTGLNRPIFWGFYITNFVFFIGISHAGTLISAILRIFKAEWRRPFTRAAEAVTVFSLPFGVGSLMIDMGRPDRFLNVIKHPQIQSPIIWDVCCVSTYLLSSCIYFYLALIPDIALCRDNLPHASRPRQMLYRILALGWKGTERQRERLEKIIGGMSIFLALLVVTVHTVVSWVFGMTVQPGWHTTIIGPYFLVGAIFSGVATVAIVMAILRKVLHLEVYLRKAHFDNIGVFLLCLTLLWFYFTFAEYITTIYGGEPSHMRVLLSKFSGDFAILFWLMFLFCFVIPLVLLGNRRTRTISGIVVASIFINIGMWLERFTIIIPSLARPRLPYEPGTYFPTWVEGSITVGCFAAFIFLFMLFTKFFPIISIWEMRESREKTLAEVGERIRSYLPQGAEGRSGTT